MPSLRSYSLNALKPFPISTLLEAKLWKHLSQSSLMLKMRFQDMVGARLRSPCRYEKLSDCVNEKIVVKQGRCFWVKKRANGLRLKGIRLSRSRKLTLKVFSMVVLTSKIVKMYNELMNRMSIDHHGVYPNIIFTSHWGLPVLSQSSFKCGTRRVFM